MQFWGTEFKKDVKVLECIQWKARKQMKGLEVRNCEEWLGTLGLSSLNKRKFRGDLVALCSFLRRGIMKGGAEISSLGSSGRMHGNGTSLLLEGGQTLKQAS